MMDTIFVAAFQDELSKIAEDKEEKEKPDFLRSVGAGTVGGAAGAGAIAGTQAPKVYRKYKKGFVRGVSGKTGHGFVKVGPKSRAGAAGAAARHITRGLGRGALIGAGVGTGMYGVKKILEKLRGKKKEG